MTHTAAELFPGWYNKGINKEATADEISLRKKAIAEIMKITEKATWLKLLKVYLGLSKYGSTEYSEVVDLVKKGDEAFSIQNDNLVRLLTGSAIAHKIDENASFLSDFLASGVLVTRALPIEDDTIPELRGRILDFAVRESEKQRKLDLSFKVGTALKNSSKIDLADMAQETVNKAFGAIQKETHAANADITSINSALKLIKQNFRALSEETNVLWWLFGEQSRILNKPFAKIDRNLLSVLTALELNTLSPFSTGMTGVDGLIQRALAKAEGEPGSIHTVGVIIESIKGHEDVVKPHVPTNESLAALTGCLTALKCQLDYSGNEWRAIFKKQCTMNLDSEISSDKFTHQLYQELIFLKLFAVI